MFGNLEAEQARKRLTNQQIADLLGLSRTSYEKKKKSGKFLLNEIVKLCEIFEKSFEYLFAEI